MREGNNPKRRLAPVGQFNQTDLAAISARVVYVGSAIHKRFPGDYGFDPPVNPRPWKSLCDNEGAVLRGVASGLLRAGVERGMISTFFVGDIPKFIWAVDDSGRSFEAKIGLGGYHGYRLEADDNMADLIFRAWSTR